MGFFYIDWPTDDEPRMSFVQAKKLSQPAPYTGALLVCDHLPNGNWLLVEQPASSKYMRSLRAFQNRTKLSEQD